MGPSESHPSNEVISQTTMSKTLFLISCLLSLAACTEGDRQVQTVTLTPAEMSFEPAIVSETANLWWARDAVDLNGDGLLDVALQNDNGHGGWLGWLEAQEGARSWQQHIIAETAPNGETFAVGDLEAGDVDNDGDPDIFAFAHPGEWDEGGAPTTIYWYENGEGDTWTPHEVGQAPAFIKDVNIADFNNDDRLDLVTITYEKKNLSIFRQDSPTSWTKVQDFTIENLHEGMDVGDIDGDGDLDIATNGYWVENPGGDLSGPWTVRSIADKWHNQDGDWSKNATKVTVADIDNDGRGEVFITHSERAGYPLAWYDSENPKDGSWSEHIIIEDWPAAQSMQIADMDLDGDLDVISGVNQGRAKNLDQSSFPVTVFLNEGGGQSWTRHEVTDQGIYNAEVADVDGDGDPDLFRLASHDAETFELLLNQVQP